MSASLVCLLTHSIGWAEQFFDDTAVKLIYRNRAIRYIRHTTIFDGRIRRTKITNQDCWNRMRVDTWLERICLTRVANLRYQNGAPPLLLRKLDRMLYRSSFKSMFGFCHKNEEKKNENWFPQQRRWFDENSASVILQEEKSWEIKKNIYNKSYDTSFVYLPSQFNFTIRKFFANNYLSHVRCGQTRAVGFHTCDIETG